LLDRLGKGVELGFLCRIVPRQLQEIAILRIERANRRPVGREISLFVGQQIAALSALGVDERLHQLASLTAHLVGALHVAHLRIDALHDEQSCHTRRKHHEQRQRSDRSAHNLARRILGATGNGCGIGHLGPPAPCLVLGEHNVRCPAPGKGAWAMTHEPCASPGPWPNCG
jgi:hypothetical protein